MFLGDKLLIASNNQGKIKEIKKLLQPYNIQALSASDFPYPEPKETGISFVENAEIKSRYYAEKTGITSLSDDSGLVVDALNGAPGVYSADWAETENGRDFNMAMQKVEDALNEAGIKTRGELSAKDKAKLRCNFTCLLSLCTPDGKTKNFEGKVFGYLTFPQRGDKGFGYDAIFRTLNGDKTFAELEPEEKHKISHRADAFKKFKNYIEQQ